MESLLTWLTWQFWTISILGAFALVFMEKVFNPKNPWWYWFLGFLTHEIYLQCVPGLN